MQPSGNEAGPDPSVDESTTEADESWDGVDRRRTDRRGAPTRVWTSWLTPKRRARGRRDEDQVGYVDRYTRFDVVLVLSIFVMNVFDAFLTMLWLSRGGKEANPVMDFFLDIGTGAFLFQKCLVVGIWLVVLLVHKNFRFARLGLYASLAVYAVLMIIHFGIIAFDVKPPVDPEEALRREGVTIIRSAARPAAE